MAGRAEQQRQTELARGGQRARRERKATTRVGGERARNESRDERGRDREDESARKRKGGRKRKINNIGKPKPRRSP